MMLSLSVLIAISIDISIRQQYFCSISLRLLCETICIGQPPCYTKSTATHIARRKSHHLREAICIDQPIVHCRSVTIRITQTICHHSSVAICIDRSICQRYRAAIGIICRPIYYPELPAIYAFIISKCLQVVQYDLQYILKNISYCPRCI